MTRTESVRSRCLAHSIGAWLLLIQTYAVERRQAKRADFSILDVLAQVLENRRVHNWRYRYLIVRYFLLLLIPLDGFVMVTAEPGLLHLLAVLRVTPFCIIAALDRGTPVEHTEPVIRCAGLGVNHHIVLAVFCTFDAFTHS